MKQDHKRYRVCPDCRKRVEGGLLAMEDHKTMDCPMRPDAVETAQAIVAPLSKRYRRDTILALNRLAVANGYLQQARRTLRTEGIASEGFEIALVGALSELDRLERMAIEARRS